MMRPALPWLVLVAALGAFAVLVAPRVAAEHNVDGVSTHCPDDLGSSTTFTYSNTHHTTQTLSTAPPVTIDTYETQVTGVHGGTTVYDDTIADAPSSQAVHDAESEARDAIVAAGGDLSSIAGPTLVQSGRTLEDSWTVETTEFNHIEETVSVSEGIGPTTILTGEDQGLSCLIPAGYVNYNDNNHTETFEDVTSTTTNTYLNFAHYELTSGGAGTPTPTPNPSTTATPPASASPTPTTGTQRIWADVDCDGAVTTRDNQAELRFVLEQNPLTQTEPCPDVNADVTVDGIPRKWGDEDCDTSVTTRDNQSKLRFVLEQNPLAQTEPCPDVGSEVTVTVVG